MYKIIIVDDETEVRRGIIEKIDFNALGYELVGEAENGVEALEILDKENPDLALIDIKMPYMDGIELSQIIHDQYPAVKVIILSGFDEFEFAQKAIRYHVLEYVLKPVSSKDIVTLLQKTKTLIDEERFKKRDIIHLKKHFKESLPIIRGQFLNALILERHNIVDLEGKLERFDIHIGSNHFIVAVVRIDKYFDTKDEIYDLYAVSVLETCRELLANSQTTFFASHSGEMVLIMNSEDEKLYKYTLEEIRATIEKNHAHTVTIGLGESVESLEDISHSYKGAIQALNYKLLEGENKIIWIRDLEPKRLEVIVFSDVEEELNRILRSSDTEALQIFISRLFETIRNKQITIEDLKLFIMEMLLFFLKTSRVYDFSVKWFEENKNIYGALESLDDFDGIQDMVTDIAITVSENIKDTRKNSIKLLIESAETYLKNNFNEASISLESTADMLHISSEYLSRQFKKEKRTTFIHYLTDLRLEEAKRLIEDTNYKNFEVADAVGYKEPNYFSYVFKKQFGISPSKYRKSIKG